MGATTFGNVCNSAIGLTACDATIAACPVKDDLVAAKGRHGYSGAALMILNLKAIFATATRLATAKADNAERARQWLPSVTSEDLLRLAMIAGAADEWGELDGRGVYGHQHRAL